MIYVSLAVFSIYFVDVLLGAMGSARFLSDVQECIILMISTFIFVIDILRRQYRFKRKGGQNPPT